MLHMAKNIFKNSTIGMVRSMKSVTRQRRFYDYSVCVCV